MLFITNRTINEANEFEYGRSITFDINNSDAGIDAFFL